MDLNKSSHIPLYIQLKLLLKNKILSGILKPGDFMETESQLCEKYKLSRYPVRQALGELEKEGYINRVRGRGTIINSITGKNKKNFVLGLILSNLTDEHSINILAGFEKESRKKNYSTIVCSYDGSPDEEQKCIKKMLNDNPGGIFIFPSENSKISSYKNDFREKNIALGLLDRNPGLDDVDYVGSDNYGGSYSAARHLAEQGYENFVFISTMHDLSSINERFNGFSKALEDFGFKPIPNIHVDEDIKFYNKYKERFYLEKLEQELAHLKKHLPLGVFAINDSVAFYCLKAFRSNGFTIGEDFGIVGFDNLSQCRYTNPPLTTVAQNGFLMGQTAANILIGRINGKKQIYQTTIPTQLIVRNSCGEK